MKLKFLGTGTSQGVPIIGCQCKVCTSNNPKDNRLRTSAIITSDTEKKILIDCGPDFRLQMLNQNETKIDAVLLTHEHNDHIIGLDDMRPIIFHNKKDMPIFCNKRVGNEVKNRFPYAFTEQKYPGAPAFELYEIENKPFKLLDFTITPIDILHGKLSIFGFKLNNLAYITDCSEIPNSEKNKLQGLDFLILNCLRKERKHHSHLILPDVIKLYNELKPKKLFLTHISHEFGLHTEENALLPENIKLAYDGLEIIF